MCSRRRHRPEDEAIEPDMELRDRRDNTEQRWYCALVRHPRPFREIPLPRVPIEIFAGSSLIVRIKYLLNY